MQINEVALNSCGSEQCLRNIFKESLEHEKKLVFPAVGVH